VPNATAVPSKGQINRCGDTLRDFLTGELALDDADLTDAILVVQTFRATFQYPMQKVAVGVRQFVQRESTAIIVAQRLKRLPQMANKLVRMPDTKLARMEDGDGPADLVLYFELAAEGIARKEAGLARDEEFETRFADARAQVAPYFRKG
jgi:hypothetical protein